MGKRQRNRTNISKRVKSSHKKSTINRKIAYKKVDKTLKNINHIISKQLQATKNPNSSQKPQPKIELETISADELRKLLGGEKAKDKPKATKINLDESLIMEKLVKKWGKNFTSMAKDINLNKMQWTQKQIEKKYEAYEKIVQEERQE